MDIDRTDDDLIRLANQGRQEALEALYYRHRDWVHAVAYRFTRNHEDALDVLQEAFAYFFAKFPGFRLTAQLRTFLYPAVKNIALTRRRKDRRYVSLADADRLPAAPDSPINDDDDLAALLADLNGGDREVVLLRFVDGLALQEIADVLDIPLGTVKSRLHHALTTLRARRR